MAATRPAVLEPVAGAPRGLVTPEAVVLELETASVGSRVVAQAIDVAVRFGIVAAVSFVLGSLLGMTGDETVFVVILTITGFLVLFGYPALYEAFADGRTIGKRAMGLRVVTVDGAPVSLRHTSIRSLLSVVDFFLPPLGVVATWTVLLSRRNQRLGDLLAGTIVLRDRTGARLPVPVSFPPLPGYEGYARSLDVGALTPQQYAVLRSFLTRVGELRPEARARLAVDLANPIAAAMGHTPPPGVTPEAFLVSVAAAYQLRLGGPPVPLPPWVGQWGAGAPPAGPPAGRR